jgi:hypothetical protein
MPIFVEGGYWELEVEVDQRAIQLKQEEEGYMRMVGAIDISLSIR